MVHNSTRTIIVECVCESYLLNVICLLVEYFLECLVCLADCSSQCVSSRPICPGVWNQDQQWISASGGSNPTSPTSKSLSLLLLFLCWVAYEVARTCMGIFVRFLAALYFVGFCLVDAAEVPWYRKGKRVPSTSWAVEHDEQGVCWHFLHNCYRFWRCFCLCPSLLLNCSRSIILITQIYEYIYR